MSLVYLRPDLRILIRGRYDKHQPFKSQPFKSQRGAALVLALTVVAIVAVLATVVGTNFQVIVKRVENQLYGKQAYAYMRGAEGIARKILQQDFEAATDKDHRSEGWLRQTVEFPLEQGIISGTLCDLQARFNINNLLSGTATGNNFTPDQELFIRLLQTLELEQTIDQQEAIDITYAVKDWIDSDNEVSSTGGAENGYYTDLDLPMRAANRPMMDISELRWIRGMNPERYRALAPHIVAMPVGVSLNVNTADLRLLQAINASGLLQPLTETEAETLLSDRDGDIDGPLSQQETGFDDIAAFVAAHPAPQLLTTGLSVESRHFLLQTEMLFENRRYKQLSVLKRDNAGGIKTIMRGGEELGVCRGESSAAPANR